MYSAVFTSARLGLCALIMTAFTVNALPVSAQSVPVWEYHVTEDGRHPNGHEQAVIWLMNRARANPGVEGRWLARESHPDVRLGREYFNVDTNKLVREFDQIEAAPPAAFDRRVYDAAREHAERQIKQDVQNHDGQLASVTEHYDWQLYRGSVFSYAQSGLNAHAAFNIDWGFSADGMQVGRGHRVGLMASDADYTNVGVSRVKVKDKTKDVGPNVFVVNYVRARRNVKTDHFNKFVVGTVWTDGAKTSSDLNGRYDNGEGIGDVVVTLYVNENGRWQAKMKAVTPKAGGYAIPLRSKGPQLLRFDVDGRRYYREINVGNISVLMDLKFIEGRSNRTLDSASDAADASAKRASVKSAN